MAREVEERINKRNQFSRRRAHNEDRDISAINDRNERFNKKLERNYSKYAAEIKSNLERGTALWLIKLIIFFWKNFETNNFYLQLLKDN